MIRSNASLSSLFRQQRIHPLSTIKAAHFSRCVVLAVAHGGKTKGQAPGSSRQPVENTHLEQNPHLKHSGGGKGRHGSDEAPAQSNATEDPKLPSHKFKKGASGHGDASVKGKRGMHWSSVAWFAESGHGGSNKNNTSTGHTADSYFKDVDSNEPSTSTTYTVGGDDATTAHRPNEQYADPKKQYATVSREEEYQPPTEGKDGGKEKDVNLRYGGRGKDSERGTSHSKESAAEGNAGGRKPEGRK